MVDLETDKFVVQRKENFFKFISAKSNQVVYLILAVIVGLTLWIRTRNVPKLIDVSTSLPTLGPDLDPFLFLRWSEYMVENGTLFAQDLMRYVPFGFDMRGEYLLHPYMMVWFHNLFSGIFSWTVTQSAIYYPVFMFGLTVIAFFLFVREVFKGFTSEKKANAISLTASLFFSIIPVLLPRTIAGIPEKEATGFFFLFMVFYLFLSSWNAISMSKRIALGIFAGIMTAGMSFVWGGFVFIFYILSPSLLIAFLIGSMKKNHILTTVIWVISAFAFMTLFFERHTLKSLIVNATTGSAFIVFIVAIFHSFVFIPYIKEKLYSYNLIKKIPPRITSFVLIIILGLILGTAVFGANTIFSNFSHIYFDLTKPSQSRLIDTVAENRQPYFGEWASSLGPQLGGLYLGLALIVVASLLLFYRFCLHVTKDKRQSIWIVGSYGLMLITTIFTRYSSQSVFNGENAFSLILYALGFLTFIYISGRYFLKAYRRKEGYLFDNINLGIIMILVFLVVSIISARGLIRLVMILALPGSIMLGYLMVLSMGHLLHVRKRPNTTKTVISIIFVLALLFSIYSYYTISKNTAQQYVPSLYTNQWQKAMAWTRENTPTDAVFGHWWDYGYWLQSIGKRATVLDGGNAISYWNHLMGRHALTSPTEKEALEFLYAHNTTYFLIDSTDIGKYTAFSSIGSDKNYDRRSWIPSFTRDNSQTVERKNTTVFVYPGGTVVDQDIVYDLNGTKIFLPEGKAYVAAVVVTVNQEDSVSSVLGIYYSQDKSYQIPLRYYWDKKTGFVDTGSGLDAGILMYPRVVLNSQGGGNIEPKGAILYLSSRTVRSQLAKLYLFGEKSSSFTLAHSEPDFVVENLNAQNMDVGDFVFFNEFRGPIKIWSIKYPSNIAFKPEYLETEYPEELVRA
ncbi:hypothetical protein J4423_02185 [Candidatus Pacearchaeota archaeon]|nr:hypothetical protein [Candidatus Pacearchaeota archaeon]